MFEPKEIYKGILTEQDMKHILTARIKAEAGYSQELETPEEKAALSKAVRLIQEKEGLSDKMLAQAKEFGYDGELTPQQEQRAEASGESD